MSFHSLSFNTLRALSISMVQWIRSAKEMQYNVWVFNFLLCYLNEAHDSNHFKVRHVKIGMTLEMSEEFTVSI